MLFTREEGTEAHLSALRRRSRAPALLQAHAAEAQRPGVDEPTNHLDLESINALNIALQKNEGTVFLVTHDHDLIEEVATRIWHFDGKAASRFQGPYEEYLNATASRDNVKD